ncbi:hypothetical protein HK098_007680 [Nowakowskiella sp. JEL0407]|nr:hypothetical protein HK098_007680 [Nowakowskiella sp. JEL0407]
MHFKAENVSDLTGKVALVTGGNPRLVYETMKQLAKKNAKAYMASRTFERARQAIETLMKAIPAAKIEFFELNLADLKQVFTTTLLPVIVKSAPSRIINLSSALHTSCPEGGILFD